jgi:two-component system, chemotaxis family, response regulator Rcp1
MDKKSVMPVEILLVEDSPSDVLITREAFKQSRLVNNIHVVDDGVKAMEFLHKKGHYTNAVRPDLVLLDLNLPRKNGLEVLSEVKVDPELKEIPVIVLTTSSAEIDIVKSYNLYANCYIVKPVGFENFIQAVQSLGQFWLSVVTLPSEIKNDKK